MVHTGWRWDHRCHRSPELNLCRYAVYYQLDKTTSTQTLVQRPHYHLPCMFRIEFRRLSWVSPYLFTDYMWNKPAFLFSASLIIDGCHWEVCVYVFKKLKKKKSNKWLNKLCMLKCSCHVGMIHISVWTEQNWFLFCLCNLKFVFFFSRMLA